MKNEYGLDVSYFKGKLELVLRDVDRYTPDELQRELFSLGRTANPTKISDDDLCFSNKGDSEENMEADVQRELDADRWNAFINSPFRLFGYAGLDHKEPNRPDQKLGKNGYAHFGCEMWTIHSGWEAGAGKNILIGYADQAIIAQSK